MRHRVKQNKNFNNKDFSHVRAMERNLLTSFFLHKSIETTEKRAKLIIPMIDKLINVVNTKDEMNAIRYSMKHLYTKEASLELFKNVAPKFKWNKTSGFTRAIAIKFRDGDNAKIVKLELV